MKCPVCNSELPSGAAFCNACGSIVTETLATEEVTASAPQQTVQQPEPQQPAPQQPAPQQPAPQQPAPQQPAPQQPAVNSSPGGVSCPRCGTPLFPGAKQCHRCGKKLKSKAHVVAIVILSLLVVALAAALVWGYFEYVNSDSDKEAEKIITEMVDLVNEKDGEISVLNSKIESLETDNDNLQSLNNSLSNDNFALQGRISTLEDDYARLSLKYDEAYEKNVFYDTYIVFYLEDGTNLFHRYDCYYMENVGNRFYAYNKNAALGQGYYPCYYCCSDIYY